MQRTRALIILAAASLVLAACRVDTTLVVRMRDSGAGEVAVRVHLDRAAVAAAQVDGRRLEDAVRIDDLAAAGWTVRGWHRAGGGATLTVAKPFADPAAADAIVQEITGTTPLVRTFDLAHDPGSLRDTYSVRIDLDPAALRTGLAEDPAIAARVRAAGVDPAAAAAALDRAAASSLGLAVEAVLPGASPQRATPADGAVSLDASSTVWHAPEVAALLAGILLLVAAVVIAVAGVRAVRRRPRGRHAPQAPRHAPHDADAAPSRRLPKGSRGAHAPSGRGRRRPRD